MTDSIRYVGVNDHDVDLFEGQYVVPNGMAYNSYVILDEKVAILDTVDHHKCAEYLDNLDAALAGRKPDYLIIHHIEPDHASSVQAVVERWPEVKLVGGPKTFPLLGQYFPGLDFSSALTVKEGDELSLGSHVLHFVSAPMVHWPEVMMSYESTEKILFSADAFGKFGALDAEEDWDCEARRYYFNIVGKYGTQVQTVHQEGGGAGHYHHLPPPRACPDGDHPHVLDPLPDLEQLRRGERGRFHRLRQPPRQHRRRGGAAGGPPALQGLPQGDGGGSCPLRHGRGPWRTPSATERSCWRPPPITPGIMPFMEDFLHHLKAKNYQKRTVGLMENGSWAPFAVKGMTDILATMKDITILPETVTLRGPAKESDLPAMEALASAHL